MSKRRKQNDPGLSETRPPPGVPPKRGFGERELVDPKPSPYDKTMPSGEQKSAPKIKSEEEDPFGTLSEGFRCKKSGKIGEGGMGEVYKAEYIGELAHIPKKVAIKLIGNISSREGRELFKRFFREAGIAIDHPNFVKVFKVGMTDQDTPYYAMELLEGRSLAHEMHRLKRSGKTLGVERALQISMKVCQALAVAHSQGIYHRDIKPSNIFLLAGDPKGKGDRIKIIDMGLAFLRLSDPEAPRLTQTGMPLGTPAYIPPEILRGKTFDHRIDIYSAGIMMFEMLSGELPFVAEHDLALLLKHVKEKPKSLRKTWPGLQIPADVEEVVMRAIAKRPSNRFQSMEEMGHAIACCLDPSLRLPRWQRAIQRYGLFAALGIAVAAGGIAFKDEIRGSIGGKAKVERKEEAKEYVARIQTDIQGVAVSQELKLEDGIRVKRSLGRTGEKPIVKKLKGEATLIFELDGYERVKYRIDHQHSQISLRMQKRD